MILLIDNYDSFVFNLARYFVELGQKVDVVRNDRIDVDEVRRLNPDAIVFSPGPCGPDEAGNSIDLITELSGDYPMLGVCLGHQSIARAFGGVVKRANRPVHGMTSAIDHNGSALFNGIKSPLTVTRYHSLVVDLPLDGTLVQTATGPDGEIMAFAHRDLPIFGVQFHPEAVLTEQGHDLLSNFLAIAGAIVPRKAAS
ncbi:aminodeoxychorismate/anthranilate synthase component II [Thalassospira sp. MCCC 1A03138]|uniref:anthranilate synthase component II n=1 Tax=Thalassospira sp. MCCC 1A03138 TaxID=1470576 RepID=UPI000A1D6FF4|nr:aminodeoxychorismate/anthranilate synthase component II [Thalassospira sp. MCCC 1A03138]OSQ30879.1 anthranilate synthase [Thalassospira sp. MCCC 1A03138]